MGTRTGQCQAKWDGCAVRSPWSQWKRRPLRDDWGLLGLMAAERGTSRHVSGDRILNVVVACTLGRGVNSDVPRGTAGLLAFSCTRHRVDDSEFGAPGISVSRVEVCS